MKRATFLVMVVGSLPLGFRAKLRIVRSNFPAGIHGNEGAAVSTTALNKFRAAIVPAVWSKKVLLASTLAVLSLIDAPVGAVPALHVVWSRFWNMRRYLAYRLGEVARIFRLLGFVSAGARDTAQRTFSWTLLLSKGLLGTLLKLTVSDLGYLGDVPDLPGPQFLLSKKANGDRSCKTPEWREREVNSIWPTKSKIE